MTPRITKSAIITALDDGLNVTQMAAKFGCSITTVWRRIKTYGLPSPGHVPDALIVQLSADGLTAPAMAKELGVSATLIYRRLKKLGLMAPRTARYAHIPRPSVIARRINAGETTAEIAAALDVEPALIRSRMKRAGYSLKNGRAVLRDDVSFAQRAVAISIPEFDPQEHRK